VTEKLKIISPLSPCVSTLRTTRETTLLLGRLLRRYLVCDGMNVAGCLNRVKLRVGRSGEHLVNGTVRDWLLYHPNARAIGDSVLRDV